MKNQKERVLEYLKNHKTITTFESFEKLQILDLQRAIYLLRNEGHTITDVWKKNGKSNKRYKEYRLEN